MLAALVSGAAFGTLNLAHCAGMCGPLAAVSCGAGERSDLVRYQLGRTAAYVTAGVILGHAGRGLLPADAAWTRWAFPLLTAAACVTAAIKLLRRRKSPNVVQLRTSEKRTRSVFGTLLRLVPRDPLTLGLLSITLPCGLLASASLMAIATGSPEAGAAFMLGFASASGIAVVGAAIVTRLAPRIGAGARRLVACALVLTAVVAVARPLAAYATATPSAASHPSCH